MLPFDGAGKLYIYDSELGTGSHCFHTNSVNGYNQEMVTLWSITHPEISLQVEGLKLQVGLHEEYGIPDQVQELMNAGLTIEEFLAMDNKNAAALLGLIDTSGFGEYTVADQINMLRGGYPSQMPNQSE